MKEFRVLWVGNCGWLKGLWYLSKAMESLPLNVKLVVVGLENKKEVERIKEVKNLELFGQISTEELSIQYQKADVLCVPSVYEAFGLVFAEAQCFGLPCIGSKGTGAEETIIDRKNGYLVEKRDVKGIANAIRKVMKKGEC